MVGGVRSRLPEVARPHGDNGRQAARLHRALQRLQPPRVGIHCQQLPLPRHALRNGQCLTTRRRAAVQDGLPGLRVQHGDHHSRTLVLHRKRRRRDQGPREQGLQPRVDAHKLAGQKLRRLRLDAARAQPRDDLLHAQPAAGCNADAVMRSPVVPGQQRRCVLRAKVLHPACHHPVRVALPHRQRPRHAAHLARQQLLLHRAAHHPAAHKVAQDAIGKAASALVHPLLGELHVLVQCVLRQPHCRQLIHCHAEHRARSGVTGRHVTALRQKEVQAALHAGDAVDQLGHRAHAGGAQGGVPAALGVAFLRAMDLPLHLRLLCVAAPQRGG
mmetsp:Transcript_41667/g.106629  ORF Transcript_41667/g.106629 Transcript_41667/m.106629 type:complete len:329 (-) Transcript_41667:15-1001(-)